jgi:uncharacterized protein involved in exopolysaccharide biosynthesis
MNSKYIDALKAEYERLRKEIVEKEKPEDFGSDVDDVDGIEAEEAEDLGNRLAIGQALRERLSEIERTLNELAAGKHIPEEELARLAGIPPEPK